ncbi:MAG: hypothetical protein ACRDD2_07260 [Sarcina sp.]
MENSIINDKYKKKIKKDYYKMIVSTIFAVIALGYLAKSINFFSIVIFLVFALLTAYFGYKKNLDLKRAEVYNNRAKMKKRAIEIIQCNRV